LRSTLTGKVAEAGTVVEVGAGVSAGEEAVLVKVASGTRVSAGTSGGVFVEIEAGTGPHDNKLAPRNRKATAVITGCRVFFFLTGFLPYEKNSLSERFPAMGLEK